MSSARILFPDIRQVLRILDDPFTMMTPRLSRYEPTHMMPMARSIALDLRETKGGYEVEAELPGVKREDIQIECKDDRTLLLSGRFGLGYQTAADTGNDNNISATVSQAMSIDDSDGVVPSGAEKMARDQVSKKVHQAVAKQESTSDSFDQNREGHRYWHSERLLGEFQRSITFPSPVQADKIKASLKDGILSIILPKIEKKSVSIQVDDI
jgi:HSP20 family protein